MILTCPSCRTRYQADGAQFKPPGRNVRCAKCGQVWYQSTPETETEVEPEPVLAPMKAVVAGNPTAPEPAPTESGTLHFGASPEAEQAFVAPARRGRSRGAVFAQTVGWLALIVLIGAIGWGTIHYRETIASLWPQSASLYATVGLPVNVRGITLTDIAYKQEYEDGQPVLSVTGKVVNVSKRDQAVPEIRVVLLDGAKHELYHWTFDAGIPTLKPGSESPFMTRLSSPPAEVRTLNVRFVENGEAR